MALQSSGAISLNDIHVEMGGTSGSSVSLGDLDIRAIAGSASGAASIGDCYGVTALTVTQGTLSQQYSTKRGFYDDTSTGSVSPTSVRGVNLNSIEECARVNASSGMFFQFEVVYSAAIPANEYSRISFVANGTTTVMTTAESSTTSTRGGYGRRWSWSYANGLDTTEISNITTEWDGSGAIKVAVKP